MDIKVDFNPEVVAQKLQEAIVSSTFNEMFSKRAKESVEGFFKGYNRDSILDRIVDDVIRAEARRLIETEWMPRITELIRQGLTEEKIQKLTTEVLQNIQIGKDRY